jgi:acetyl-CoA carboxylase biotin carboxyl carrier protein
MKGSKRSSQTSDLSVPGVDLAQLERLLVFMSEHGLEEFEYAHGDLRIRLKKALTPLAGGVANRALLAASQTPASGPPDDASPASSDAAPAAAGSPGAPAAAPAPSEELHIIKSPIVGTFYSASNPESDPFVKVGDMVEIGQTVCIIEAMKLMNEIEADVSGEVVRVLVENGQPIEYGEALFALRPTGTKK